MAAAIFDCAGGISAPSSNFQPLRLPPSSSAADLQSDGTELWLIEVPADFDEQTLDGVQFEYNSGSGAAAASGRELCSVGRRCTLRTSEPAFATQFVSVFPDTKKRKLIAGERFRRVFSVTTAGHAAGGRESAIRRRIKPTREQFIALGGAVCPPGGVSADATRAPQPANKRARSNGSRLAADESTPPPKKKKKSKRKAEEEPAEPTLPSSKKKKKKKKKKRKSKEGAEG